MTTYYDSLIAKTITTANTRKTCIKRMLSDLDEFFVDGINTNHALQQKLLKDQTFCENKHNINYLEGSFLEK